MVKPRPTSDSEEGATRPGELTELLAAWRRGDASARDRLIPLVHGELRRLAEARLRRERRDHSLDPTELVHEAYLRLADKSRPRWRDRAHFYAVAAQLMRRILVDHARGRVAAKRGGKAVKVSLGEVEEEPPVERDADLVALDDALETLAHLDPIKARIIELRFFGGLTLEETAEVLELSTTTVAKGARLARSWLHAELARGSGGDG